MALATPTIDGPVAMPQDLALQRKELAQELKGAAAEVKCFMRCVHAQASRGDSRRAQVKMYHFYAQKMSLWKKRLWMRQQEGECVLMAAA